MAPPSASPRASGDGTLAAFNLTGSDAGAVGDVGNVDQSTYDPTNLLTQGAGNRGDTIEIKIGTHVTTTIDLRHGAEPDPAASPI